MIAAAASAAPGTREAPSYEFFYTTTSQTGADVWRASFITAGAPARLTAPVPLASVPHATGIFGLSDGQLLIGAPGRRVYAVNARTGAVHRLRSMPTHRVVLQPSGQFAAPHGRPADAAVSTSVLNLARVNGLRAACVQASTDDRGELILACRQRVVLIRLSSPQQLDAVGASVSAGRLPAPVSQISPSFVSDHPKAVAMQAALYAPGVHGITLPLARLNRHKSPHRALAAPVR